MNDQSNTYIVTGAGGNLGKAVCHQLLSKECTVIAAVRPGKESGAPEGTHVYGVDLIDKASCSNFLTQVHAEHNSIAGAVFTAGGFAMHDVSSVFLEDIRRMISINFETAFHLSQGLLNKALVSGAELRMTFIGSRSGLHEEHGSVMTAYTFSKRMLSSWSKMINAKGSEAGVKTAVFAPGIIDTPQNREAMPGADTSSWIPPAQLAKEIVHFLSASPDAASTDTFEYYGY